MFCVMFRNIWESCEENRHSRNMKVKSNCFRPICLVHLYHSKILTAKFNSFMISFTCKGHYLSYEWIRVMEWIEANAKVKVRHVLGKKEGVKVQYSIKALVVCIFFLIVTMFGKVVKKQEYYKHVTVRSICVRPIYFVILILTKYWLEIPIPPW